MSTKVYNGMVIPLNKFEEFIRLFNNKSIKGATKFVQSITSKMNAEKCQKQLKEDYGENLTEELAIPVMTMYMLIQSSKKSEAGFNVDVWFNAWIMGKKVYLYAPADRFVPTAKDFPSWCKDFSYWNNTDRAENVSQKEWYTRAKIWDSLLDNSHYKIQHIAIEAKDLFDKGILKIFPNITREKMFGIHSTAYFMEKMEKKAGKK